MASTTNDSRLTAVTNEKKTALNTMNSTWNNMINQSDSYYQKLIDASKDYSNTQQANQQNQTNFAIEKLEQEKEKAERDYTKEQKGAYTDYMKATDQFGMNAEAQATAGLNNSGYTETAKMSAFNTYQNRYATARETFNDAVLGYNNSIKDAILSNNSQLAEIAYNALKEQLELGLEGFQYKNDLLQQQFENKMSIEDLYEEKYNNVLSQINTENELAEEKRQFNAQLYASGSSSSSSGGGSSSSSSGSNATLSDSSSGNNAYGNSASTTGKSDYYFSNGYQPSYINNTKLKSVSTVSKVFGSSAPVSGSQSVWSANGKYYVWVGNGNKGGSYVDVTAKYNSYKKNKWCVIW